MEMARNKLVDKIGDDIINFLLFFDQTKEKNAVLSIAGLIPEVGTGAVSATYSVPYDALKAFMDSSYRAKMKTKLKRPFIGIGSWLKIVEQKILYLIKYGPGGANGPGAFGSCTWKEGQCVPFPDEDSLDSLEGSAEKVLEHLVKFLLNKIVWAFYNTANLNPGGLFESDENSVAKKLSVYDSLRTEFMKCEEEVLNPLYEMLSKERIDNCPQDFESMCVAHVCIRNEHVKDNKCVPCEPGLFRDGGDPAGGGDTQCAKITCKENQYVYDNDCVDCAEDKKRDAGDDPTGENTVCANTN